MPRISRLLIVLGLVAVLSMALASTAFAASASSHQKSAVRPFCGTLYSVASAYIYNPATHATLGVVEKWSDGCGHVKATTTSYVGVTQAMDAELYTSQGSYLTSSAREYVSSIATSLLTVSGNTHACGFISPQGGGASVYACTADTY